MTSSIVFVVDDDAASRDSIGLLLETAGFAVECYASAEAFLEAFRPSQSGCLILDVRMDGMSGPALQAELVRRNSHLPIIFLTAHGDIPTTVRAMRGGAVDFLTKPADTGQLMNLVRTALEQDRQLLERRAEQEGQRRRLAELTPREKEIMLLMVAGKGSKSIAQVLGISHRTVEIHRSHLLHKTATANVLELAKLAADCGWPIDGSAPPSPQQSLDLEGEF